MTAAEQARGVLLTFFGEGLSLNRFKEICRLVEERLPADAEFQAAMAEWKAWTPRVLLTVFDA